MSFFVVGGSSDVGSFVMESSRMVDGISLVNRGGVGNCGFMVNWGSVMRSFMMTLSDF